MPDVLLNVTQTAELLSVHANTVRAWATNGTLRPASVTPSGHRRFSSTDVERLAAEMSRPPEQPTAASSVAAMHSARHVCVAADGSSVRARPGSHCLVYRLAMEVHRLQTALAAQAAA